MRQKLRRRGHACPIPDQSLRPLPRQDHKEPSRNCSAALRPKRMTRSIGHDEGADLDSHMSRPRLSGRGQHLRSRQAGGEGAGTGHITEQHHRPNPRRLPHDRLHPRQAARRSRRTRRRGAERPHGALEPKRHEQGPASKTGPSGGRPRVCAPGSVRGATQNLLEAAREAASRTRAPRDEPRHVAFARGALDQLRARHDEFLNTVHEHTTSSAPAPKASLVVSVGAVRRCGFPPPSL